MAEPFPGGSKLAEALAVAVNERDELERTVCAKSLAAFVKRAWKVLEPGTELKWGWALDAICQHLEAVEDGRILRLLINLPPGMMKSLLTGVFFPAWLWGPRGEPHLRIIGSSYSETYAARDARRMRDLVRSPWYQRLWGDKVRLDRVAETSFSNTATGSRDGVPMARLTAGRADLLILDDPHSVAEAESDAERSRTVRLFRESITTRVNDPSRTAIVVIMQRLHERDISGVITGENFGYEHLLLPMRYEPERRCRTSIRFVDPRTEPGQLLFPERFPEDVVARDERAMGSYAVASQYQQRPAPRAGGMIQVDRLDMVRAVPSGALFCRAWDLAATAPKPGGDADWSVGALLARHGTQTYVVDIVRFRETAGRRNELIRRTAARDRDAHGTDVVTVVEQEPGSGGKAQVAHLRDLLGREGLTLRQVTPTGSKATRADPLAAAVEAGEVHLVGGVSGGAPWHAPLVDEMRTFPAGAHDDQVDAVSTAFNALATRARGQRPTVAPSLVPPDPGRAGHRHAAPGGLAPVFTPGMCGAVPPRWGGADVVPGPDDWAPESLRGLDNSY